MRLFYKILKPVVATLAIIAIAVAAQSCGSDSEPEVVPGGMQGNAKIGFTLTVSDSASPADSRRLSKATPADGTYDPGSGYENYIDIKNSDFRFYFFSTDDKFLGSIEIISIVPIETSYGYKRYVVQGSLPADLAGTTDFKVCVLANWNSYPELAPGDPLEKVWTDANAMYDFVDGTVSETRPIPLYGIKRFTGKEFKPDEYVALDNIHLLRAYAKVEINLDRSVDDIKSITVTRVNDKGCKAPANVNEENKYVHNTYEQDYVNTPHIPATTTVRENVAMHPVTGAPADTRRYIIYLPEYDNTTSAAIPARIQLTYKNPSAPAAYIDFKYYESIGSHAKDAAFDLLRNYWYRFNVSKGNHDLTVYVDVQPYAEVTLDPDFGLERDEEGYIIVRNHKGEVIKYIRTDGAELTLGDVEMPFFGTIRAVFDSKRRALLGYLSDGRRVYWNYDGDTQLSNMISWEIYTDENDTDVEVHLDEDYVKMPTSGSGIDPFTQSFYDDNGRVIKRYLYPSNEVFERRTSEGEGAKQLVSYTGSKYGAKVISYWDLDGRKYCDITVKVDAAGNETEIYTYY